MTDSWQAQREALGAFIRTQRKTANLSLRQLAELTSLSNPYLSQVERLNTNRRQLASAPRQLLSNIASSARIIAFIVLLATVSPWLLLVPLAAAPPLVADRIAKKITRQADDEMAHDRRLAAMLFGLSTDAGAAGAALSTSPACRRTCRSRAW